LRRSSSSSSEGAGTASGTTAKSTNEDANAKWKTVSKASARGEWPVASASVDLPGVVKPVTIMARVAVTPGQRAEVNWNNTCNEGTGSGSGSGQWRFNGHTSEKKIPFPTESPSPDVCFPSVTGSLQLDPANPSKSPSGVVNVEIRALEDD
jgi:hypothetical protein